MNPAIYLISMLPGFAVWQLTQPGGTGLVSLFVATGAVALLQHGINLLNDLADWRLGADVEKWDSWVRCHGENTRIVARHGWLSLLAGGLLGGWTLAWNGALWILAIAGPLVMLGYLYNSGRRPLSYTHLGEWVTGLCYGPGVFGCLWLLVKQEFSLMAGLGCLAFGCLAVALLLSHQPPQVDTDRQAGKQSFAVRYGVARTYVSIRMLFLVFLIVWPVLMVMQQASPIGLVLGAVLGAAAFAGSFTRPPTPKYLLLASSAVLAGAALGKPLASAWFHAGF